MGEGERQGDDRSAYRSRRYTVTEAAEILGITVEAVRSRIKRGTLEHERTDEGVFVWLDTDRIETGRKPDEDRSFDRSELVEALREQVADLREQLEAERAANRENRRLLAAALERIPPQLEAPPEAPESPESAGETSGSTQAEPEEPSPERPSWWRRWFGG